MIVYCLGANFFRKQTIVKIYKVITDNDVLFITYFFYEFFGKPFNFTQAAIIIPSITIEFYYFSASASVIICII